MYSSMSDIVLELMFLASMRVTCWKFGVDWIRWGISKSGGSALNSARSGRSMLRPGGIGEMEKAAGTFFNE